MKSTPLTDTHIGLGARMAEFAGYNMPISYAGIREEHEAVRKGVGVFDVSHMGEFIIKGKQAFDLLQKVTSNNVAKLEIGDAQYSCLPNNEGGIVDDLLVYRLPEDKCAEGEKAYMVVVNASNIEKDWDWIEKHNSFEAEMHNISYRSGLLAVQGPKAHEAMQSLTEVDLAGMKYYTFKKGVFAGIENVLISATGYTGSGGFELYCDNKDMKQLWDAVMAAGKDYDIAPCGLGARDTLRLEMGFALYGNDINDTTSPIEAGLGWITKTKKGDFTSRDIFVKQREEGTERKLVGFVLSDRRAPRHDYPIVNAEGEEIGIVTSGTISPTLDQPIGMGYVKKEYAKAGTEITIMARKKELKAVVKRPPFVEIPK